MTAEEDKPLLVRGAWVVPVNAPPLANGAVLVMFDRITAVDTYPTLAGQITPETRILDCGDAAIVPALVNAHTHMELTSLRSRIPLPQPDFPTWLRQILPLRATLTQDQIHHGWRDACHLLLQSGSALCGDVANRVWPEAVPKGEALQRHTFVEVVGFNLSSLGPALQPMGWNEFIGDTRGRPGLSLSAHACYSASASLIRATKDWDRRWQAPFTIHVAEHPEEIQFLQDGTGFCRDILQELGRWVPEWQPPGLSPVAYLDRLGVLDEASLLVHAVHLSAHDWQIVAERHSTLCFCPRSNAFLQVGRPDIETAVRLGIPAALGTDSMASNTDLNLFAEAAFVLDNYPSVPAEAVLHMATLGGARALHRQVDFGSIEPGKRAALLNVQLPPDTNLKDLMASVIQHGSQGAWQWVVPPHGV